MAPQTHSSKMDFDTNKEKTKPPKLVLRLKRKSNSGEEKEDTTTVNNQQEQQPSSPSSPTADNNNKNSNIKKPKRSNKNCTPPTKKAKTNNATDSNGPELKSFGAIWAGNYPLLMDTSVKVHTLILGTHPGAISLEQQRYYAHPLNAFWWIAGDCLGFRRDQPVSEKTGKIYNFAADLQYDNIIPYDEQLKIFCQNGFAIWDVIQSCRREGSLDQNIEGDIPNDIEGFCNAHPTIRRIVFSSGGTTAGMFKKHFKDSDWMKSGKLIPADNPQSQQVFKQWKPKPNINNDEQTKIELVCVISVSPAAAKFSYKQKRDEWKEFVYDPGLADHCELIIEGNNSIKNQQEKEKSVATNPVARFSEFAWTGNGEISPSESNNNKKRLMKPTSSKPITIQSQVSIEKTTKKQQQQQQLLSTSPSPTRNNNSNNKPNKQTREADGTPTKKRKADGPELKSFGAIWAGNYPLLMDTSVKVHTLILGTHPGAISLEQQRYYAHPLNAFWWIAGDCLGFRRDQPVSEKTGKVYNFAADLQYDNIIPYDEQLKIFCQNGFAIWDVIQSCRREGSLDQNIEGDIPNDIEGFCNAHPTIRRIVFSSGGTTAGMFKKHFKDSDWMKSGKLIPADNPQSQQVFKQWKPKPNINNDEQMKIELVCVISVSPAAAKFSYKQKRDEWKEFVYEPGLLDHEELDGEK